MHERRRSAVLQISIGGLPCLNEQRLPKADVAARPRLYRLVKTSGQGMIRSYRSTTSDASGNGDGARSGPSRGRPVDRHLRRAAWCRHARPSVGPIQRELVERLPCGPEKPSGLYSIGLPLRREMTARPYTP